MSDEPDQTPPETPPDNSRDGERIAKFLARAGVASRRDLPNVWSPKAA